MPPLFLDPNGIFSPAGHKNGVRAQRGKRPKGVQSFSSQKGMEPFEQKAVAFLLRTHKNKVFGAQKTLIFLGIILLP